VKETATTTNAPVEFAGKFTLISVTLLATFTLACDDHMQRLMSHIHRPMLNFLSILRQHWQLHKEMEPRQIRTMILFC